MQTIVIFSNFCGKTHKERNLKLHTVMFIKSIHETSSKECLQVQGILQMLQKRTTSTKRQYQMIRRAKHAPNFHIQSFHCSQFLLHVHPVNLWRDLSTNCPSQRDKMVSLVINKVSLHLIRNKHHFLN